MHTLHLNFHGLVHVWASHLSDELFNGLNRYVGHFKSGNELPDIDAMDVMILPLASEPFEAVLTSVLPSPYGMSLVEFNTERGIVFNYRGEPDLVLMLGKSIRIYYRPRKKNFHRIYGLMLFSLGLVLRKKNGLLFHGASVYKNEKALLLTGLRGAKKTQLMMTLLHNGWHYISDDKLILHNGHMHLFQDMIPLTDHHVDGIEWLYEILPGRARRSKGHIRRSIRKQVARLSRRYFNKHFLPVMEKFYDPYLSLELNEIFPSSKKCSQGMKPSSIVLLSLGQSVDCSPEEPNEVIEEISAVQNLQYYNMGPLEQLIFFCNKSFKHSISSIVKGNLSDCDMFRLSIPGRADINEAYECLMTCLEKDRC